ncbi:hypothetical protein LXA43DRAFT_1155538 [Ganoderma leucocontextum]|nr:hypothetical protein LXA43DRAFT_1155538 [Ganoderma leucocontextum]
MPVPLPPKIFQALAPAIKGNVGAAREVRFTAFIKGRWAALKQAFDGFLDMILPTENNANGESAKSERGKNVQPEDERLRSQSRFDLLCDKNSRPEGTTKSKGNKDRSQKPVFTVEPAGIAEYLLVHIDGSLDWIQVDAGQVIWGPEDTSDSVYIVIKGRLRAITEKDKGAIAITADYGQRDTVGELGVITSSPRRDTLHAIRDTELIPQTLFNAISARNPRTTAQLLRMIASRVRIELDTKTMVAERSR